MNTGLIITLVVVVLIIMALIGIYNRMVTARNKVKNQFSQIDVQLKQRFDMIPNLVEIAKGYAKFEQETLQGVIEARNKYNAAGSNMSEAVEANDMLSGALSKLFALAEAYPDLKANTQYQNVTDGLNKVEDNIRYARQFYNDEVTKFNTLIQTFPNNVFAAMFRFTEERLFEVNEAERENVKISM